MTTGGLIQALAHDDALDRVERAPALDLRIHLREWIGTILNPEQPEQVRQRVVERRVERGQRGS